MDSVTFKRHNSIQKINIIEKQDTPLFPDLRFLSFHKKFKTSVISVCVGACQMT